jgi:hypothetical protein
MQNSLQAARHWRAYGERTGATLPTFLSVSVFVRKGFRITSEAEGMLCILKIHSGDLIEEVVSDTGRGRPKTNPVHVERQDMRSGAQRDSALTKTFCCIRHVDRMQRHGLPEIMENWGPADDGCIWTT